MLRNLGAARLAILGVTAAALIGFFLFIGMKVTQPRMALLYGNLDLQDSANIVARLEQQKVPYQIAANGAQVLVPEDRVLRLRMQMAEAGVPAGGSIGYELFDKANALSATNFMQNLNHLRAMEGELARTIRAIDQVQSARVHLVLPKREVFSREQREPSASIVIKTRGGRLDQPQVRAIQNLVAGAVPDLKSSRVAIIDDRGNLLAGANTEEAADPVAAGASKMVEVRRQAEDRLRKAIETLLERSVGIGNVRAEVSVDMDFDRVTTNQELFDPEQQVVRSTRPSASRIRARKVSRPSRCRIICPRRRPRARIRPPSAASAAKN